MVATFGREASALGHNSTVETHLRSRADPRSPLSSLPSKGILSDTGFGSIDREADGAIGADRKYAAVVLGQFAAAKRRGCAHCITRRRRGCVRADGVARVRLVALGGRHRRPV